MKRTIRIWKRIRRRRKSRIQSVHHLVITHPRIFLLIFILLILLFLIIILLIILLGHELRGSPLPRRRRPL
jgi:hypothetical protein